MKADDIPTVSTRAEFGAAVLWGFGRAIDNGARRIICVDRDFADWPLSDAALLDRLATWTREPLRRLVLLATSYDAIERMHPRFVAWRALRSHAVEPWSPPEDVGVDLPAVLLDDGAVMVRLLDPVRWRGRAELDARSARLVRDEVDALLQRSEAAFAVNRLGL